MGEEGQKISPLNLAGGGKISLEINLAGCQAEKGGKRNSRDGK